jgi:glycosyltransferase involved in cell wall biosynthesis
MSYIARNNLRIAILDDAFPDLATAFRVCEFRKYFERYPEAKVYSVAKDFRRKLGDYLSLYPQDKDRIQPLENNDELDYDLFYSVFLNNIFRFLPMIIKEDKPFVFTLYPGGGFSLNDEKSDEKLRIIFGARQFQGVIVTQKVTYNYLLKKKMCPKNKIHMIYGGVFPSDAYAGVKGKEKVYYPEKKFLDICFVANKYTELGRDKGYDIFIEAAKILVSTRKNIYFHVVGNFTEGDIDVSEIRDHIRFYGNLLTKDFIDFYSNKDIILSPNRSFVLDHGSFDGFPTGACMEAGLNGALVMVTDPLNSNIMFKDKKEIVIVPPLAREIVETIDGLIDHAALIKEIGVAGRAAFWDQFDINKQVAERYKIFDRTQFHKGIKGGDTPKAYEYLVDMAELKDIELLNLKEKNSLLQDESDELVRSIKRLEKTIVILGQELEEYNSRLEKIYNLLPWRMYRVMKKVFQGIFPSNSYGRGLMTGLLGKLKNNRVIDDAEVETVGVASFSQGVSSGEKRVLVIPSWYPTMKHPLVGTFFQEQSLLMEPLFNMRVIYGEARGNLRGFFGYAKNGIVTPPSGAGFYFKKYFFLPERINNKIMVSAYVKVLKNMTKDGWRPDLIHAHSTVNGGIVAQALSKEMGIPYLITEHQLFLLHNYSRLTKDNIISSLENADKVLAVSSDKKRAILMHGIDCEPIIVGNLVDDNLFVINKNSTIGRVDKKFEILIVAGSSFIKDLPTFLKAIKEIRDCGVRDIHATVLGGGLWGDERSDMIAEELGIADLCDFIDMVSRGEMVDYFNKCDVFVSTSIAEGFQVTILEAMACGKPVVSTMHGGVEDIISDENGILVPIKDYKAIADGIIAIKDNLKVFNAQRIRDIVVSAYGKVAFRDRIARIYDKTIKEYRDR